MPAPVSNTNGLCNGGAKESRPFVFRNLHYLPITGFLSSLIAMIVPYAISVYLGDTPAILPFISDAGGDPPQSIVFGLFLGVTSFTAVIGMYMKYLMVWQQNRHIRDERVDTVNRWSCMAGLVICLGGLIVALSPTGHLRKDCTWYPQGMLSAVVAEWLMVFIFQSYVLTYIPDFRKATFVLDVNLGGVCEKKE
nr:DNA damage-regulated autophagy modulator protein 1-like [Rhipicephalus microplus]